MKKRHIVRSRQTALELQSLQGCEMNGHTFGHNGKERMKKLMMRLLKCVLGTFVLLVFYFALSNIWKGEDWIGTYYGIKLNSQYTLWTIDPQGSHYSIQDNKAFEEMPSEIDSVQVAGNYVLGHSKKGYFLIDMKTQKLVYYAAKPMIKPWNDTVRLMSPHTYYQQHNRHIDIICMLLFLFSAVLLCWRIW